VKDEGDGDGTQMWEELLTGTAKEVYYLLPKLIYDVVGKGCQVRERM
jgi:hypothetical protein